MNLGENILDEGKRGENKIEWGVSTIAVVGVECTDRKGLASLTDKYSSSTAKCQVEKVAFYRKII